MFGLGISEAVILAVIGLVCIAVPLGLVGLVLWLVLRKPPELYSGEPAAREEFDRQESDRN